MSNETVTSPALESSEAALADYWHTVEEIERTYGYRINTQPTPERFRNAPTPSQDNEPAVSTCDSTPVERCDIPVKRYEIPVDHGCSERTKGNRMIVTRLAAHIAGRLAFELCLSDEDIASPNIAQRVIEDAILEVLDRVDLVGLQQLSQHK